MKGGSGMKKLVVALALLLGSAQLRAQSFTLTVTNTASVSITTTAGASSVTVYENSSTPTAAFAVVDNATPGVTLNFASGQQYTFVNSSGAYPKGTVIGSIKATTSGSFTFVVIQRNLPVVLNALKNSGSALFTSAQVIALWSGTCNGTTALFGDGSCQAAGGGSFSTLTSGTNTSAAMLVGTGASLGATGSGTITATAAPWSGITSTPTTLAGYGITNGVANTVTVNGHALSSNVTVSASDLTTGTLPHGQLPALVSGDIPNNAANTTGSAAKWTTARNLAGNSVDGSANVAFANNFIVQGTADAGLSAAQFLGALGTGILKNTTTTGVLSIAVGSDLPSAIPIGSVGSSGLSGTSPVTISAAGAIGCATCITGTPTNHGIALGSATQANSYTAAGTSNQVAASGGASADPTYKSLSDLNSTEYVAGGGTAQAQTATLAPAATALTNGLEVRFLPTAANTAAAPTLAVNGLAAKSITKFGTVALVANDLTTTAIARVVYDGTEFQLQNPQSGVLPMTNNQANALPTASTAGNAVLAQVGTVVAISQNGLLNGLFYPTGGMSPRPHRLFYNNGGTSTSTLIAINDSDSFTCSTASAVAATSTASQMLACLTSVTNGNVANWQGLPSLFPGNNIWFSAYGAPATTATTRYWVGLTNMTSAQAGGTDTCSTFHCAAFLYSSSGTASTTNYECITNAGGTGTQTVVDSGVTVVASTPHVFDIREDSTNAKWYFYIDGVSKCSSPISTTLPTAAEKVMMLIENNGSGSVAAQMNLGFIEAWADH